MVLWPKPDSASIQDLKAVTAPETFGIRESLTSKDVGHSNSNGGPSMDSLYRELSYSDLGTLENSLAICLHGTKETAKVSILPSEIVLNDLQLFEVYDRVLSIRNKSLSLPIIIRYIKKPSIEVQPSQIELGHNETFEVTISIRPAKLGKVITEVKFDLLYYNYPRSKDETLQTVGSAKLRIEYCATLMEKKEMVVCKCDTGKISQLVEPSRYRRTVGEKNRRDMNNAFYEKYISQKKAITADKIKRAMVTDDYELTNQKLLLARNLKCSKQVDPLPFMEKPFSPFIPLMPKQLYNIKIYPKFIRLENQAPHTVTSEMFTIENRNDFPVRIFLKPSKSCVSFESYERVVIKGGEVQKIPFIFTSYSVGKYHITIFVVVNESHMFQVSAVADVIPKTVRLHLRSYEFTQNDDSYIFLELENDLNAFVGFEWTVPRSCFNVYPNEGQVPPKRTIVCVLDCIVDPNLPELGEAVLTSEGGRSHTLQISHNKLHHNVVLNTDAVDFETIPLNRTVTKYINMTNLKCDPVFFTLENPEPIPGITIIPSQGVVTSKDSQIFEVVVHMKSAVRFSVKINVIVQSTYDHYITISGIVEFPQIRMTPDVLVFRKVSPFSFDRIVFKVRNLSSLFDTILSFPFDDYPELSVTESELQHWPHRSDMTLAPDESKILFLHFRPYHVSTASLLLPFQLNNIIGPPDIHDNLTTQAFHFIETYHAELRDFPGVSLNENYNRYLPTVRVSFSATERTVSITNLDVRFIYFGEDHYANKVSADVEILNVSNDPLEMCIRKDSVAPPFEFSSSDTNTIEMKITELAYLFKIEPSEKVVFSASYCPEYLENLSSTQRIELPIFIRNYQNDTIFNSIALQGSLKKPTITPSSSVLYFEPAPMAVINQNTLVLYVLNHFPSCEIVAENLDNPILQITFPQGHHGYRDSGSLTVVFSVCASNSMCFKSKVTFSCTCGITSEVILKGAAENCILTAHTLLHSMRREYRRLSVMRRMFMPSKESLSNSSQYSVVEPGGHTKNYVNKNDQNCFPFFPADDDTSFVAEWKRLVLSSVERWIYCQGFFTKRMYRIPESFTKFPEELQEIQEPRRPVWARKETNKTITMPLVELIANLVGDNIQDSIVASPPASNTEVDRLMFYYTTYRNALDFLHKFDVYLPNVEAKYLLTYQQYLLYHKLNERDTDTVFNLSDFNRYTKQCWMDLILQIIKVFVLLRNYKPTEIIIHSNESLKEVVEDVTEIYSDSEPAPLSQPKKMDAPSEEDIGGVYHQYEHRLMLWLNEHYEEQRENLWGEDSVPKTMYFFDSDLDDALILAALTAAYCPYATSYIRDMYCNPYNSQQIFHNACRLVQTWKLLKLSFEIHPSQIVKPCMVEMLLLVSYLYEILPMYNPKQCYTIQAPLTKSSVANIQLRNHGNTQVIYEAILFGNEKGCFQLKSKIIKIPPRSKKTVTVTYLAKYIRNATTCLLLAGETSGQKYSRSFAYHFQGVPDHNFISQDIGIEATVYKFKKVRICLTSPFKTAATYKVFVCFKSLESLDDLLPFEKVTSLVGSKICRWGHDISKFNEEGKCDADLEVATTISGTTVFRLYFQNDEVGDFGIRITLNKKMSPDSFEHINVPIPKDFDALRCVCKPGPDLNKQSCPKILKVMIPSRNEIIWDSRKSTLLKYMDDDEKRRWEDSLGKRVRFEIRSVPTA